MLQAISVGILVLAFAIAFHGAVSNAMARRLRPWIGRYGGSSRQAYGIVLATVGALLISAAGQVALWAGTFVAMGWLPEFEGATYFAAVTFTTVGYGDIVLAPPYRIVSGLTAMNGLIVFSWSAALLVDVLHQLRQSDL